MPRLTVLHVVSECVPLVKTGGLADVAAALPSALRRRGHDVRVLMPRYRATRSWPCEPVPGALEVPMGLGGSLFTAVHRGELDGGVPIYLLEHDALYDRDGVYGDAGGDFGDNDRRFALLCRAALRLGRHLGWRAGLYHVHDWPAALVPAYVAGSGEGAAPSVLTLHNLGYQGVFGPSALGALGLRPEEVVPLGVEHFGSLNFLKAGLTCATMLTTVSPRYAHEIQTPEGGAGLDGVLRERARDLVGILNGIDDHTWDPATDPSLPARYSVNDMAGKAVCKAALQRELGLAELATTPIVGLITRFAHQKGIDLLAEALRELLAMDLQIVLLGSGDAWAQELFTSAAAQHPRLATRVGYDERLAHLIEAGSDLFLMPSRYEPCGLNQMYSQRYGTLPIVRSVGGLDDTVEHGQTGFKFEALSSIALVEAVRAAVSTYRHQPDRFAQMRLTSMRKEMGWDAAAARYEALYRLALARHAGRR